MKTKTLLLATDLPASAANDHKRDVALRQHSDQLARDLSAPIELVHVDDLGSYPIEAGYRGMIRDFTSRQQKQLKRAADGFEVKTRSRWVQGRPVEKILSLAKTGRYGMIAVATHGRTGLKRLVLGSVAEEIIRNSKLPVLVVGPKIRSPQKATASKRANILVGTDLGPNSRKAEAFAARLASQAGTSITLVHCLFEGFHPVLQTAFAAPSASRQLDPMRKRLFDDASRAIERRRQGLEKKGISAKAIVDATGTLASDLILSAINGETRYVVLGTHGRNLAASAFFGSTARHVVLGSPVPVITVRS